jgi:membrane-associated phospholipid phosphatase
MGDLHSVRGQADWELRLYAARTTALLALLFVVAYSGTNWITTLRAPVPEWCFAWEATAMPFVPLMIVPYMSIDLFFLAAPFLCGSRQEVAVLARRVAFAIAVACALFLLMPLQLAYKRDEEIPGLLGVLFDGFRGMDAPHNLFPSLHIALRVILAATYALHTRGIVKMLLQVWFSLIALSTVLTHQHHLVDIAGGAMLGGFALYLFQVARPRLPVTCNHRIGGYYAAGAVLLLVLAAVLQPWGAFLLWPAGTLAIVACAYFGWGPGIFCKADGRLPVRTLFALGPVLVGQHLSLLWYRRRCRAWDEAAPGVLIGRQLNDREAAVAIEQGVTAVLDLTGEFSAPTPFLTIAYRNLPILDLTAPTQNQLRAATTFIAAAAAEGTIYVHCKIGYSRSAAIVGAYLLASGQADNAEEAIAQLRQARPSIIVRDEAMRALNEFASAHASAAQYAEA